MAELYNIGDWQKGRATELDAKSTDPALQSGGGGGTSGGMEARIAKLEATSEHMVRSLTELRTDVRELKKDGERDFRLLFIAIVTVALGLAWMMAKGFHWL